MVINKIQNRWQAFGAHLFISFIIFVVLASVIFFVWFPGYTMSFGGTRGIKILAGVDLVLGPVLTLIVFNRAKKNLRTDLFIIGVVQISCLAVGTWLVYKERPMLEVISYDGIYIAANSQLTAYNVDVENIDSSAKSRLKQVFLSVENDRRVNELAEGQSWLNYGKPLAFRADLYKNPEDIPIDKLEDRLSLMSFPQRNCTTVNLFSPHAKDEQACVKLEENVFLIQKIFDKN